MRRNRTVRIAWGRRLTRGGENARLARALDSAEAIRDTRVVAGALVWDRAGTLTLIEVLHESGRRTVETRVEVRGQRSEVRRHRGLRAPGLARVVLHAMGFGK